MRERLLQYFGERTRINSSRFIDVVDAGSSRGHWHLVQCDVAFQLAVFGSVVPDLVLYRTTFLDDIIGCVLRKPALQSRRDSSARYHGLRHG